MPYLVERKLYETKYNYAAILQEPEPVPGSPLMLAFYSGAELSDDLRAFIPKVAEVGVDPKGPKEGIGLKELDSILYTGHGVYAICSELKEKLEELEPNVHEFFPLRMTTGGKDMGGLYYLLYVTQKLDAIVYDKTDFAHPLRKGIEAAKASGFYLGGFGPIVLKKDVIAGRHLWRGTCGDPKYFTSKKFVDGKHDNLAKVYFISDELAAFLKDKKMRGWKLRACAVD